MTATIDEPGLGRYELLAKIGQGPRGPVFVACAAAAATVELYVIEVNAFASGEDDARRELVRDVDAAARLAHRNVVAIVEHGATTAGHYVVGPYLDGCTLADLEARHRMQRPPPLIVTVLLDALHGLAAAHAASEPLVHGSLSPDRLFIGIDGVGRIGGFGRARARARAQTALRSNTAAGYLAPEQLVDGAADPRSDVFSIGVVLWNALTGKRLFHDPLEAVTATNVLERRIPRPSLIGLAPPAALDPVVMKALERQPARRFHSVAELAMALGAAAHAAGCLASAPDLAAWVSASFGNELATRHETIHARAARSQPSGPSGPAIVVLPRLVLASVAAATARDHLSRDELARVHDAPPLALPLPAPFDTESLPLVQPAPVQPQAGAVQPASLRPGRPGRTRRLALIAAVAIAVIAGALGWHRLGRTAPPAPSALGSAASASPAPPTTPAVHVTVLGVRTLDRTSRATAPSAPTSPAPEASPRSP